MQFNKERSIWKRTLYCGAKKTEYIFQIGRREVISFMQIGALLAQMDECFCRAIMNHSSCRGMLARGYGAPDLTSLSA